MQDLLKPIVIFICCQCLFLIYKTSYASSHSTKLNAADINYLVQTFQEEGFEERYLYQVFTDPRLRFIPGLVKRNVINKRYPNNYKRFLEPVAIARAKKFARKWQTALKKASHKFDVDTEVIIAILLVETSLGQCMGSEPVLSVFISIMLENYGKRWQENQKMLAGDSAKNNYLNRLAIKAAWAKRELYALLTMEKEYNINIYELKGSYAGAFGIPQFLPSSYLKWGCDGDQSNTVNLFYMPDAITSVVNYLKAHGWKRGLSHASNKKVLWYYNRNEVYVETVLQIAQQLRKITESVKSEITPFFGS